MKRRFRITITPDVSFGTFIDLQYWVLINWGCPFTDSDVLFRGWTLTNGYCAGIEVTNKAS